MIFAPQGRLPRLVLVAYGLPALPAAMLGLPLLVHLPGFYAQEMGIGLTSVGTILLLARLWDGVTDPLIGFLSDRTRTRLGRRRPWIIASLPLVLAGAWLLFRPPEGAGASHLLIWSFVVNNYLLGKDPFPFDLLYWNSDSTRMPAAMHSFYLRSMYQENRLATGEIDLLGTRIDLTRIRTPSFLLSTREDHIAPWKSTFAATHLYRGPVRFVLAASGHIAGVVNPPAANKYSFWTNEKKARSPAAWLEGARQHDGSWWPEWQRWVGDFANGQVAARDPATGKLKPIEDAPGSYVATRA